MDKLIKKISGAVIASVLALTLSSKAYADPVDEPVSDLPVPQCEEKITDPSNSNSTKVFTKLSKKLKIIPYFQWLMFLLF